MTPLLLHLKDSWQWRRPLWRSAWIWLLANAAPKDLPEDGLRKGQVYFSLRRAKEEWGMPKTGAQRFLERAEIEGDITWERSVGGRPITNLSEKAVGPVEGLVSSRITILNHATYSTEHPFGGPVEGPVEGPIIASNPIVEVKKKKGAQKTVVNTVEEVQKLLAAVDLAPIRQEFGLDFDVDETWEQFCETCVNGTAQKPRPNPYLYKDFRLGFLAWCRKRRDQAGRAHIGKPKTTIGQKTDHPDWFDEF